MPTQLDKHYDALVIGWRAAGSIAVKELTERGLDVLLLEAGRATPEADFIAPSGGSEAAELLELVVRHQNLLQRHLGT